MRAPVLILLVAGLTLVAPSDAFRARPAPLANTVSSPERLAHAVAEAMNAGDVARLNALALSEDEFRAHVWPGLPASRPERNVPFDFVWSTLHQNSQSHLRQTLASRGDVPLAVRRVQFAGEATSYGEVLVRRKSEIIVAGPDGSERALRLFGSVIEQNGAFKVFSYVVDE